MTNLAKYYFIHHYNINITSLCHYCGISRTTFYNIINGNVNPKVDIAIKICKYLRNNCGADMMKVEYAFMEAL